MVEPVEGKNGTVPPATTPGADVSHVDMSRIVWASGEVLHEERSGLISPVAVAALLLAVQSGARGATAAALADVVGCSPLVAGAACSALIAGLGERAMRVRPVIAHPPHATISEGWRSSMASVAWQVVSSDVSGVRIDMALDARLEDPQEGRSWASDGVSCAELTLNAGFMLRCACAEGDDDGSVGWRSLLEAVLTPPLVEAHLREVVICDIALHDMAAVDEMWNGVLDVSVVGKRGAIAHMCSATPPVALEMVRAPMRLVVSKDLSDRRRFHLEMGDKVWGERPTAVSLMLGSLPVALGWWVPTTT